MDAVFKAFERNSALLLASENWAEGYLQAPEEHARLLKATARLERKLIVFFKDEAAKSQRYVNWMAYGYAIQEVKASQIKAYDINVIVNDDASNDNEIFIGVVLDEIALATSLGTQAGQTVYKLPFSLPATDASIQRQARKQVAALVGKRVLDDGSVVDNPNPQYLISNTTRNRIKESIHTSIMLGEDVQAATARMVKTIKDPKRAELIAHQEMGMAYTNGLHMYGTASGAIGKEWQTNGAIDICATNAEAGPIPFDKPYPSGVQHPLAHIGCKCYERLIYQNELVANPNLFN